VSHKKRSTEKPSYLGHVGVCDTHGKRIFTDRRRARREIRVLADPGMREYRCDVLDGAWHIGHLPLAVVEGRKTAGEVYG